MSEFQLDDDLLALRGTLHQIDDERLWKVQRIRDKRDRAAKLDDTYSFARLLQGLHENDPYNTCPLELAESERIAKQVGRPPRYGYLFVPIPSRRDLTVANDGGYLTTAQVGPGGLFVHYLDESLQLSRLGIRRLSLQRSAVIPRISATVSTTWLQDEGTALSESQFTFVQAANSPKHCGAYCEVSRQWVKQASDSGMTFVMRAMAQATAAEVTRKVLMGSGANGEISGLLGQAGASINAASMNLATCLDAIEDIETAAAIVNDSTLGFVLAPDVARDARGREKATGSGMLMERSTLAGYPAQVSSGLTVNTGICGDWSQLVLMEYSILEVSVDPYGIDSALFKKGVMGIRSIWSVDAVLLNPASFCELTNLS